MLIYLCIVLIYGTYLCLTQDNMQIPAESNDDYSSSASNKELKKQRLRGINDTHKFQDKQQQQQQQQQHKHQPQRKVYTDDDFICDCNNVYREKEQHELEREIIQDMINKHYVRSGKKIQTYYADTEDDDEDKEKIREENNRRICDCEGNRKNKTPHEWILLIPPSNVMLERENKTSIKKIDEISRTHLHYALASMFEAR